MPNVLAFAMIIVWPIIGIWMVRKMAADKAAILLFLVPYLILPVKTEIDLPVIPPFDKRTVPALVAFAIFYLKYKGFDLLPKNDMIRRLIIILMLFPVFTYLANRDTLEYGPLVIPGLKFVDIMNMLFFNATLFYIPFMIGVNYLKTNESHFLFLKCMVVSGLLYSVLMLWEVRMSPQLHTNIYGFFPHNFGQQMRQGGFRPIVFLGHGLVVAVFITLVFIAATTLWKEKVSPMSKKGGLIFLYLLAVIVLCKTVAALLYAGIAMLALFFLGKKWRAKVCVIIASVVFIFPILRGSDLIPTKSLVKFFEGYSAERAESLQFRLDNEDILLEKANARRIFGWGIWGRSRVYDAYSGEDLSVTDGYWIITFGRYGWLGYVVIFGLLCYPLYVVNSRLAKRDVADFSVYTTGIGLMLAINLFDFLPNSSISPLTCLMAGALLGRVQSSESEQKSQ